jgi:acetyl esterase/lipase
MARPLALLFALLLLAVALLTAVPAPAWLPWQLAVLAGEFGHLLAVLVAMLAAVTAWTRKAWPRLAGVTLVSCGLALALLLKPGFQAWRIGRELPPELTKTFAGGEPTRPALSVAELYFGRGPQRATVRTLEIGPGLPLDFYAPVRRDPARLPACVIVVHGGGWDSGERTQLAPFNHALAERGYAVAAISYRLAPRFTWPAQRDDLLAAIALLKERAGELGLDPARLVVLGRSAGGQIALATTYARRDPSIRGVVGFYAPSDLVFGYVNTHEDDMLKSPALMRAYLGGTPETARENYESASALRHVTTESPPTLLLHGENDALVWHRHSVRLAARLREAGVRHAFVSLPWATHAFDFNLHGPGGQLTRFALEWFLADVTR